MKKAKVTLTFDDALDSHLDHAVPLLDDLGLRATFFVNISSECLGRRATEWRKAASNGHELGNHSLLHPAVLAKDWVREANALENYTLDRMRMELEVANNVLRMLDGRSERTFAFPCGNNRIGKCGWTRQLLELAGLDRTRVAGWVDKWHLDFASRYQDYTDIVGELFFAARRGELSKTVTISHSYDRYSVPSVVGDFRTAAQLMEFVNIAVRTGAWIVFSFHGIGGGHSLCCDLVFFQDFIKHLALNDSIIVEPFLDAAKDVWG